MPKSGSSLGPAGVEFVAEALARCQTLMQADPLLSGQSHAHNPALSRYLMRRAIAGDTDADALADKALHRLRLAIRRKSLTHRSASADH